MVSYSRETQKGNKQAHTQANFEQPNSLSSKQANNKTLKKQTHYKHPHRQISKLTNTRIIKEQANRHTDRCVTYKQANKQIT